MFYNGWCGGYGGYAGGWGMMIFWILLIIGGFFLANHFWGNRSCDRLQSAGETPLDILNRRFARGEISEEEYDRSKERLNK